MAYDKLNEAHARTVEWQAAFIQGVAASAIAFAIHETSDRTPSFSLIPITMALCCWAGSFACGVLNNHARQAAIAANIGANVAHDGGRTDLEDKALSRFASHTRSAGRYYMRQLWLILAGAVLYVGGHGMHILENERTKSVKPAPAIAKSAARLIIYPTLPHMGEGRSWNIDLTQRTDIVNVWTDAAQSLLSRCE